MSGGGKWLVQNKTRPGAYINFVSEPRAVGNMGSRGIVAVALPMSWGPEGELIKLTGDMLLNGKSIPVVGCDAFDFEASLKYRCACAGSFTALLFRTDRGGKKAKGTIQGTVRATAKYNGVCGNKLNVEIATDGETVPTFTVNVLFNEIQKETFTAKTIAELYALKSDYVTFGNESDRYTVTKRHTFDGTSDNLEADTTGIKTTGSTTYITNWGDVTDMNADLTAAGKQQISHYLTESATGTVYEYTDSDETGVTLMSMTDPKVTPTVIPTTAGTPLVDGEDGVKTETTYSTFLDLLDWKDWQCMTIMDAGSATLAATIKAKIEIWRENRGKKVQAVVYNAPNLDYEGVISVDQGYKTADETVGKDLFMVWVASMTAGAEINESLTASVVENAVEIIDPVFEDDIADELKKGRFLLTYREDYAVVVEQDINTFHTYTTKKNSEFHKNRLLRVMDQIGNDTKLIFSRNYMGKEDNTEVGRNNFKGELIHLIDQMVSISAVQNFDGGNDVIVSQGEELDAVVVDLYIQPVDAMEKLYMTVYVRSTAKSVLH